MIQKLIALIAMISFLFLMPSVTGAVFEEGNLSKGDRNNDVVLIQEELADLGLYDYKIDGIFGPITDQGVINFQKNNKLLVDGIVGPETAHYLLGMNTSYNEPSSNNQSKNNNTSSTESTTSTETSQSSNQTLTMEATYYTAFCDTGCIGITATGVDVSNTIYHPNGTRIVAVDPNVIPLGTQVRINGEVFTAADTGGAIKNLRVDILVSSKEEARQKGRHNVQVEILN